MTFYGVPKGEEAKQMDGPRLTDDDIEKIATGAEWENLRWVADAQLRRALTWIQQQYNNQGSYVMGDYFLFKQQSIAPWEDQDGK